MMGNVMINNIANTSIAMNGICALKMSDSGT